MPVRCRSASSIAEMSPLPLRLRCRSRSTSGSAPSRTTSPSRASIGGSSASVAVIRSRSAGRSSSAAHSCASSGACRVPSVSRRPGTAASERARATRSRGPAVPSAARATRRWTSWTCASVSRRLPRSTDLKARSSTASRRSRMASSATSGFVSQARSRRAPIAVTVSSSTPSSDTWRSPSVEARTSRWRSVVASMIRPSRVSRYARLRTCVRSPFCVSRRYWTRAPAAPIAHGWPSRPKPASPVVCNCSVRARCAASTENCHRSRRVTAGRGVPSARSGSRSASSGSSTSRGSEHAEFLAQQRGGSLAVELGRGKIARRQFDPRQAPRRAALAGRQHGSQERRRTCIQVGDIGQRARRDHARHLALDQPLGRLRVLDLIADRDAESLADQAGDVSVGGMERDAAHRDAGSGGVLRARGEGQLEGSRRDHRVFVEQLVEVAHAEEQQGVGVLALRVLELTHRRGQRGGRSCQDRIGHRRQRHAARTGKRPRGR